MATGVYCIRNLITSQYYIGSAAISIEKRWAEHSRDLRVNRHHNYLLQAHWRFYGASSFRFSVLEECPPEKCIEREQYFIDIFDPAYNICRVAGSTLGRKHSTASRAKMSASCMGRKLSPETRAKISAAGMSRPKSAATIAKLSASLMGHKLSQETRRKIGVAASGNTRCLGRQVSPETRYRMSIAQRGREACAPETRAKLSAAGRLRIQSPVTRAKIGAANRRRICSPETGAKISAANRRRKCSIATRLKMHASRMRYLEAHRAILPSFVLSAPSIPLAVPVVPV
jgi:hypothetical protein